MLRLYLTWPPKGNGCEFWWISETRNPSTAMSRIRIPQYLVLDVSYLAIFASISVHCRISLIFTTAALSKVPNGQIKIKCAFQSAIGWGWRKQVHNIYVQNFMKVPLRKWKACVIGLTVNSVKKAEMINGLAPVLNCLERSFASKIVRSPFHSFFIAFSVSREI